MDLIQRAPLALLIEWAVEIVMNALALIKLAAQPPGGADGDHLVDGEALKIPFHNQVALPLAAFLPATQSAFRPVRA